MTINELAYLKCPDKIRTALINTTGTAPSVEVIRQRLGLRSQPVVRIIEEPTDADGEDFRVRGLVREADPKRRPPSRIYKPKPATLLPREYKSTALSEALVREVCRRMGITETQFYSSSRKPRHVHSRAIVCRVLRERNIAVYSFPRIGACIGREDHSTVRHLVMKFDVYCRHPDVWDVYEAVRSLELSQPLV